MRGLTLAVLVLIIAVALYLYKEHNEIFGRFLKISRKDSSQKEKVTQDTAEPSNRPEENIPQDTAKTAPDFLQKNASVRQDTETEEGEELVTIIKVESGTVFYTVRCQSCNRNDNQTRQIRNPLPGMNRMELFRCPYCGKASKIYIEHQPE
ncbi:MAG: hypothetical protein JW928_06290 [Candidatus Aureabacteria bacterium]|nr:hypothetical protein [Candidatus Auribacterota bacterium]